MATNNKIIGSYINGNYRVTIYDDGTKVRENDRDYFEPAFAENCDVKITDKCDGGCPMCYEGCTPQGFHADLLSAKFIDSLHPYTELAINGNDLSHPQLVPFLEKLREKKVIANMTVNQIHFESHWGTLRAWADEKLIWGLGVSLRDPTPYFIRQVKKFPNTVIHTINGILTKQDLDALSGNKLKILVLGYKPLKRGADYYEQHLPQLLDNIIWLKSNIGNYFDGFECMSFDNLALRQLNIHRFLSEEDWQQFYMGDDGKFTFYIDMVEGTFAKNSVADPDERYEIGDKTIDEMFQIIRGENCGQRQKI